MPNISVGADFNEAIRQTVALNDVLAQQGKRLGEVTQQMNTYNALGKAVRSVTQGLTEDGKKFVAVLKEQKELVKAATGSSPAIYKKSLLPEKITFTDAKKAIEEVGNETDKATKKAGLFEAGVNRVLKALSFFVAYRAFNFVTKEIEESTAAANKLQIQLSLIRTISQDNQTPFGQLGSQVKASSNRSGFDINDTAKAFYDTVSNQVAKGGEKVKAFVDTASDLARVTGSTLPDAGNTLTSVINAYGKSATDAERISAILFRTVDEGRIVLSETANTLGRAAVLGNSLGVSFEELSATLAITTQKGFKTADSMTLITNLLIKLEKPTEETKKLFESLGVATGEEAIRIYGFTGVLQKMVDLTKAGIVPVSAFFDEIRGRKQFAIFEQSIGQIDEFKNKLNDVNATAAQFGRAKDIRGESNADQLNKQLNVIKNFFVSDVGNKIIEYSNDFLKFGNSVHDAARENDTLRVSLEAVAAAFFTAGAASVLMTYSTSKLTTTAALLTANFAKGLPTILKWGSLIFAAVEAGRLGIALGDKISNQVGGKAAVGGTDEEKARYEERIKELRQKEIDTATKPSGLGAQEFVANESYRQALALVAQLSSSNKKLFDDIKVRSGEAAESLKVGFATFGDVLRQRISDLKKKITEAREEIDKSQKSSLKFGDSIRAAKFAFQETYAESTIGGLNSQAIQLAKQRVIDLEIEIKKLYDTGDKESLQEARRLQAPYIEAIRKVKDLEEAERGRQFAAHPDPFGRDVSQDSTGKAVRIRTVDPNDFYSKLDQAEKFIEGLEAGVQEKQKGTIANTKKQIALEVERERRFEDASKKYRDLSPTDKDNSIKKEFQDQHGNFDIAKYNAEEARRRKAVQDEIFSATDKDKVSNTGEDYRFKAAEVLADFQKSKILELAALERQVFFDNLRAKVKASEDQYKEDIKKQQKIREEASTKQERAALGLSDTAKAGADYLNSQRQALQPTGPLTGRKLDNEISKTAKTLLADAEAKRQGAIEAINTLRKNQTRDEKGGLVTRPEDYVAAEAAIKRFTDALRGLYELQKNEGRGSALPSVGDKTFNDLQNSFQQGLKDVATGSGQVTSSGISEDLLNQELKKKVTDPLLNLQRQFPDLADAANKAAEIVNNAFKDAATQGIDSAIGKIKELQLELKKLNSGFGKPINATSAADFGNGSGEVYAASGGIVGMFPGQPRGVDRYPIWAAEGETIVDASTSRMYRPMLEAIMQRRMPRYMAGGGVVGSSTNVGDINVTVNGATTNEETGRSIALRLQREARRRNINLF